MSIHRSSSSGQGFTKPPLRAPRFEENQGRTTLRACLPGTCNTLILASTRDYGVYILNHNLLRSTTVLDSFSPTYSAINSQRPAAAGLWKWHDRVAGYRTPACRTIRNPTEARHPDPDMAARPRNRAGLLNCEQPLPDNLKCLWSHS